MKSAMQNKYGRLMPIKHIGAINKSGHRYWECLCECGNTKIVSQSNLRSGAVLSCGCLQKERAALAKKTHGSSGTSTYETWCSMKKRCSNKASKDWAQYGGRGIAVCSRWQDFALFLTDMGDKPANMTLDRINPDGNYEPENCRWATIIEQARNKRTNVKITAFGKTKTLPEWSEEMGIHYKCLAKRIRSGWPPEKALTLPSRAATLVTNLS
jgi:hypothetical protein